MLFNRWRARLAQMKLAPAVLVIAWVVLATSCVSAEARLESPSDPQVAITPTTRTTEATTTAPPPTRPRWLGLRPLPTNPDGSYEKLETPPQLLDRAFVTEDSLPAPTSQDYQWSIAPFEGEPLLRSTHSSDCPVPAEELSYLTMSFWGFDGLHHTGEMVVATEWAESIVKVFGKLHEARFPLEEMRLVTPSDLTGISSGDTNNTTAYACRAVTGGRRWSDHAYGTAIDINPFHNPYGRGDIVLPGLAKAYLDRSDPGPGMIVRNGIVVQAFAEIGWSWGGDWKSLVDYQHFSLSGR